MKINTFSYPPDMEWPDEVTLLAMWTEYLQRVEEVEPGFMVCTNLWRSIKARYRAKAWKGESDG